jgi:heat shock protein HslJ
MPDDQEPDVQEGDEKPGAGEPRGFMVSVAVILIAILVILVVYMNISGQGANGATAITENTWSLQSIASPDGNGTTIPVLNGTTVTAEFAPDGTLDGSGGCNNYSARYMVRETLIVVSRVTRTSLGCRDPNASLQEEQYYGSLEDAYELRVQDRVLTLFGTDGKPLLVFTPAVPGN